MTLLNDRYDYGLDLCLLSIDEGISGYRDASLDVRAFFISFFISFCLFLNYSFPRRQLSGTLFSMAYL